MEPEALTNDWMPSNPQIERDASPAAMRLLARAPHLER